MLALLVVCLVEQSKLYDVFPDVFKKAVKLCTLSQNNTLWEVVDVTVDTSSNECNITIDVSDKYEEYRRSDIIKALSQI